MPFWPRDLAPHLPLTSPVLQDSTLSAEVHQSDATVKHRAPHRLATTTPSALDLISESLPPSSCPTHSPPSPHAHPFDTAASSRSDCHRQSCCCSRLGPLCHLHGLAWRFDHWAGWVWPGHGPKAGPALRYGFLFFFHFLLKISEIHINF
jgi:hypothetical protein